MAILYAASAFIRINLPTEYAGMRELASVLPIIVMALSMYWTKSWQQGYSKGR